MQPHVQFQTFHGQSPYDARYWGRSLWSTRTTLWIHPQDFEVGGGLMTVLRSESGLQRWSRWYVRMAYERKPPSEW